MLEFKPFDIDDKTHGYCAEENGEGLVRSALNFAANRNAYMSRANVGRVEKEPFITLGFEEKNGFYESDIPSALTGSCGHCTK